MSLSHDTAPKACSHLDSHADTCAAGPDMVLLTPSDELTEFVDVCSFSKDMEPIKNIPIGTCATAWTDPDLGQTCILVFHQTLFFGDKIQHSLLCPNQIRSYRPNVVEDCPRQFDSDSQFQTILYGEDRHFDNFVSIPLSMDGCMAIIETHLPTSDELETCPFYVATSPDRWCPYSPSFRKNESSYQDRGICQLVQSYAGHITDAPDLASTDPTSGDPTSRDSTSGDSISRDRFLNLTETSIEEDFNLLPRLLSALTVGDDDDEVYSLPLRGLHLRGFAFRGPLPK